MSLVDKKIAILGATSHIAKGLIERFISKTSFDLSLFARSPQKVFAFLNTLPAADSYLLQVLDIFETLKQDKYDAIINCIGVGTHNRLQNHLHSFFTVREYFDNLVLQYLAECSPDSLYINFSSGAVYGRNLNAPVTEESKFSISVNNLAPVDYYSIAAINSEAKHRAHPNLTIVDLRIFSYFSRHIDLSDSYFICDLIKCIINGQTLETNSFNIVRDYIHPDDLFDAVMACAAPVEKNQILEYFSNKHKLKYVIKDSVPENSLSGFKHVYYSINRNSSICGYLAGKSSIETLAEEAMHLLK